MFSFLVSQAPTRRELDSPSCPALLWVLCLICLLLPEDFLRGFLLCLEVLGGSCQAFDLSKDWLDSMSPALP